MGGPDAEELDRGDVFLSRSSLQRAGLAYAGALDVRDPRVSPLFADLAALPPTEVHAGSRDQLVSDARRLVQRATEFPAWDLRYEETPGMVHDWAIIGLLPEARRTLTGIASRIGAADRS